jgi:hypothetical protein
MNMMRQHERPAIMRLLPRLEKDDDDGSDVNNGRVVTEDSSRQLGAGSVLEVQLWKPEALHAMLELDSRLVITNVDLGAQLIWGHEAKMLLKQHLQR